MIIIGGSYDGGMITIVMYFPTRITIIPLCGRLDGILLNAQFALSAVEHVVEGQGGDAQGLGMTSTITKWDKYSSKGPT